MRMSAISSSAWRVRSGASSRACFSLGSNGQIIASEVTSPPSGASSIASQSASMPWRSK